MSQRSFSLAWLATLVFLTLLAGFNWVDLGLSPAAGGQLIPITGFVSFPIISALLLLQGASLLAAVFSPLKVSKVIAVLLIPIVAWHAFTVLATAQVAFDQAVAAEITKATGVVGSTSQSNLIELVSISNIWFAYPAMLVLNLVALVGFVFAKARPSRAKEQQDQASDAGELWESQS